MDDNRDKEMMRNQLIAIILMTVLFVVWFKWFMPPPQPKAPAVPPQAVTQPAETKREAEISAQAAGTAAALPNLPPVPKIEDPAAEEVALSDERMELVFTRIGGRLKRATLLLGDSGQNSVQLVPVEQAPDTEVVYPLGLRFTDESLGEALNFRRFDVEKDPSGKTVTFSLSIPGKGVIRKRFSLSDRPRVLETQVDYVNEADQPQILGMDQTPAYYLYWGPNVHSGDEKMGLKQAFVWYQGGNLTELATSGMTPPQGQEQFSKSLTNPEWVAVKSAYFVVALKPGFEGGQGWAYGNPKQFRFGIGAPRFEVQPKGEQSNSFSLYMGPDEQRTLAAAWPTLPHVLRFFQPPWGFMDWFAKVLLGLLNWFYAYVPNYGLGIIFVTIVVRIAIYPLTLKSMRSMKKMQLLGPELEELKKKYSDNQQELNKKMMEMYKERGVNPLGGCLPMLLQTPVFFALYRMLSSAYELRGAPFVGWITDLTQPDRMLPMPWMQGVPFLGPMFEYLNLLPILMGVAMVVSQKVMPVSGPAQNPQQKMMMNIMPVFMSFMFYTMPSGLNLYFLTSTILGVVQQKFIRVADTKLKEKKKAPAKRQHFYTAAMARKRQVSREAKREKKKF